MCGVNKRISTGRERFSQVTDLLSSLPSCGRLAEGTPTERRELREDWLGEDTI